MHNEIKDCLSQIEKLLESISFCKQYNKVNSDYCNDLIKRANGYILSEPILQKEVYRRRNEYDNLINDPNSIKFQQKRIRFIKRQAEKLDIEKLEADHQSQIKAAYDKIKKVLIKEGKNNLIPVLDQCRNSKTERELEDNSAKLSDFIADNKLDSVMEEFNRTILYWKKQVVNDRSTRQDIFNLEEALKYICSPIIYKLDPNNPAGIIQRYIKTFNFLKKYLKSLERHSVKYENVLNKVEIKIKTEIKAKIKELKDIKYHIFVIYVSYAEENFHPSCYTGSNKEKLDELQIILQELRLFCKDELKSQPKQEKIVQEKTNGYQEINGYKFYKDQKTIEINGKTKTFKQPQYAKVLKYCLAENHNFRIAPETIMKCCKIGTESYLYKITSGLNSFLRNAWNIQDKRKKLIERDDEGYYNIEIQVKK